MSETAERLSLAALGASAGFRSDARFSTTAPATPLAEPEPALGPENRVEVAYAEGFAAGASEALEKAAAQARIEMEAREALTLSFTRLDREMVQELESQLLEVVAALCESAMSPLALDEAALLPRITRAAAMLARTQDERVIRLNPDDIALVPAQLRRDWCLQPDGSLPRGTIRVDGAQGGGVQDSPEQWSRAIREGLSQC